MAMTIEESFPQTEEGLQLLLTRLAECRADGDRAAEGRGLLKLAHLVKWVRSDNDEPPFARAHTLALEALAAFREVGDVKGQIAALQAAAPFAGPDQAAMLEEAARLAAELDDPFEIAWMMHVRARNLALTNREEAAALHLRALGMLQNLGNLKAQAQVHFSLALCHGTDDQKREHALESARLFREVGALGDAGRSAVIASMNSDGLPPEEQERILLAALADAQACGDRGNECVCYFRLARVAKAKGDRASARRYRRWGNEMRSADGLTPKERKEQHRPFAAIIKELSRHQGQSKSEREPEAPGS